MCSVAACKSIDFSDKTPGRRDQRLITNPSGSHNAQDRPHSEQQKHHKQLAPGRCDHGFSRNTCNDEKSGLTASAYRSYCVKPFDTVGVARFDRACRQRFHGTVERRVGILAADAARLPGIGHQDFALTVCYRDADIRRTRYFHIAGQLLQIERGEGYTLESALVIKDGRAKVDTCTAGNTPDLVLANGKRPFSKSQLEVSPIRKIVRRRRAQRVAQNFPFQIKEAQIGVFRVSAADIV